MLVNSWNISNKNGDSTKLKWTRDRVLLLGVATRKKEDALVKQKKMNTFLYFGNASSWLSDWSKWNKGQIKSREEKKNKQYFCLKKKGEIITCWLDVKHWQARMQERYYIFWMSWSVDSISSCRSLFFSFWASMSSAQPKTHAHTRSFILSWGYGGRWTHITKTFISLR